MASASACQDIDPTKVDPTKIPSTSFKQMKAYKSLDAHNQFTSGWVHNVRVAYPTGDTAVITGWCHTTDRESVGDLEGRLPEARIPCSENGGEAPTNALYATNESGYIESNIYLNWLKKCFNSRGSRPILAHHGRLSCQGDRPQVLQGLTGRSPPNPDRAIAPKPWQGDRPQTLTGQSPPKF
uniref:Uncharacterized protein n=1 Tax=Branchiostoma floridae TaxID=7739 RepID=C3YY80_BRAFL|eukprot:XP_002598687.1 hypothetical protein BRAFLDRAFT_107183 [Branchiostoma floridae]